MVTVTFVRHGESEDNTKTIWAGWKDAPLSELGQRQAKAVGKAFSTVKLTHIYASPLKRAHSTGLAIYEGQSDPKPPFVVSPDLREQNFGVAEGNEWIWNIPRGTTREELYAQGKYPIIEARNEKFPDGESLEDLARRCERAVRECILLHIHEGEDTHIVLASHGLCISELVSALLRLDPHSNKNKNYTGLLNTAWTRATVRIRDDTHGGPVDPSNPPPLEVQVTHINKHDHLRDLAPAAVDAVEDESKAEARAFFGGGLKESNADGGEHARI